MSTVISFDTTTVRSWNNPQRDTFATVNFPRPYVAPPRLAHGLRQLEIAPRGNIHVQGTIGNIQKDSAIYHVSTLDDTELYSGILDSLILAPANLNILCDEHRRDSNFPASLRITFARPFVTPPKVVVFFNAFELERSRNWRLSTTATDIDKWGFTLNISTWGDTVFHSARVGWIVYPEDRKNIFSTSVSTGDVRPSDKPQLQQGNFRQIISFGNDVEFLKHPDVFVAFNRFDIDCKARFGIKAYVDNVSTKGLALHIDSCADSILYSAAATIIAVN